MSEIKGDFIGFTFNGVHSSELGIIRVSDGNRYTENLLPTLQEKTVQVPGADGTYYFGSYFTQRPIDISISFDDMSEEQFLRLHSLLGDKKIHDLIFDEAPYKVYRVKATGTPNLKYVCFDKGRNEFERDYNEGWRVSSKEELYSIGARKKYGRVYKGEGQLNFVSYSPFARSRFKYRDEYRFPSIPEWGSFNSSSANFVNDNSIDWIDAVGLKRSDTIFRHIIGVTEYSYRIDTVYGGESEDEDPLQLGMYVYNPGVAPTNFILNIIPIPQPINSAPFNCDFIFENKHLLIKDLVLKGTDEGFRINTALNLIEGIKENKEKAGIYEVTGNLYNEFIKEGDFFKIPESREGQFIEFEGLWNPTGGTQGTGAYDNCSPFAGSIIYNYLFY